MNDDEMACAQELIATCKSVHNRGMVSGSGGNISARLSDGFLITPTGRSLGHIEVADLVRVRLNGQVVGAGKPSKEWLLHLNCYLARRDVNRVVHVHSLYSVAVSCLKNVDKLQAMPIYTLGYSLRIKQLPVLPYLPSGSAELAELVGKVIGKRNSLLLGNHGVVCVGSTMEAALNLSEEIEANAKLYFLLGAEGSTVD